MAPTIRVSDETFSRLEQHAQGFDTPDAVITRLLDQFSGKPLKTLPRLSHAPKVVGSRDRTKYKFNGHIYGKGRLVHAVVAYCVEHWKKRKMLISYKGLLTIFPDELQGSKLGVICKTTEVASRCTDSESRYFMKSDEQIELLDCEIVVCSQWGANFNGNNIGKFVQHMEKKYGYEITQMNSSQ